LGSALKKAEIAMKDALLLSTYRHWVWSDKMKELFELRLTAEGPLENITMANLFLSCLGTCMCLWYSLLYATCEGLEEGGVDISYEFEMTYPEVRNKLRRFRNATFHVQDDLEPDKLMDILRCDEIVTTIRTLHQKVGEYLVREIKMLPSYQEGVKKSKT
jgi:hypothetical protein